MAPKMRFLLPSPRHPVLLIGRQRQRGASRAQSGATGEEPRASTDDCRKGARSMFQYHGLQAFVLNSARQTALMPSLPASFADAKNQKAHHIPPGMAHVGKG